jgi:hypothetical protein
LREDFENVPQADSHIQVSNGQPGLRRIELRVNGRQYRLDDLQDGAVYSLDVSAAMRPGAHNTIVLRGRGAMQTSAVVVMSN